MKRILAINPWIFDFAAFDLWIKPLGLIYIISILKEYDCEISFIDCLDRYEPLMKDYYSKISRAYFPDGRGKFYKEEISKPAILKNIPRIYGRYGFTEEVLLKKLDDVKEPDIILITSMMTYWYPAVFRMIEILKARYKKCKIVLGGIYTILFPEHAKKYSGADFVLNTSDLNYITDFILKILEMSVRKKDYNNFNNVPMPDYSYYSYNPFICIMSTKGCLFDCAFCASKVLSPHYSAKEPIKFVDELELLQEKYNVSNFVFYDDALFINPENHIKIILKEIIRRKLKTTFQTPNAVHAKFIDEELAELMKLTNFQNIRIGYESFNPKRQEEMMNKVNNEELEKSIKNLLKVGFTRKDIGVYYIIGFPDETYEELKAGIDYILSLGAHCRLADYSPVPYTKYWFKYNNFNKEEPLLHNNSIFFELVNPHLKEKYHELKNYVKQFYN
ncbi:MAG TPA: radical SAM protein [bacterium]|nr:radical SAM protein [bacterium]HOL48112.1 radical SAM protein [bacterium]HPQ18105.1 radical SAM protein [bacterium]